MSKKFQSLETHVLLCPYNDLGAQINAAAYIAKLNPSLVTIGGLMNTGLSSDDRLHQQSFYDAITGYDNPDDPTKKVPRRPGAAIYSSVFEAINNLHGTNMVAQAIADVSEAIGEEPSHLIPYYHVALQLRDSGIPFSATNMAVEPTLEMGQPTSVAKALFRLISAEQTMLLHPDGISDAEEALRAYRNARRTQADLMENSIKRTIKKQPSQARAHDEKIVVVTDNPQIYKLRKEQPSRKVTTFVQSFSSMRILDMCGDNHRQILSGADYGFSASTIDYGIHLPAEVDEKIGLTDRLTAYRQALASISRLGFSNDERIEYIVTQDFARVRGRGHSIQLAEGMQDIILDLQRQLDDGIETDPDYEMRSLVGMAFVQRIIETFEKAAS